MTEEKDWDGVERRSVQLHIIKYIDDKLATHQTEVQRIIDRHTKDEMARFSDIVARIDRNNEMSAERHDELVKQLSKHLEKTEAMEEAFLHDEDGARDFLGHHDDHRNRKKFGDWLAKAKDNALTKIIEYVSVAIVVWIGFAIFTAVQTAIVTKAGQ